MFKLKSTPVFLSALMLLGASTVSMHVHAQQVVYCNNCRADIAVPIVNAIANTAKGAAAAGASATTAAGKIVADANAKTAGDMEKAKIDVKAEPLDPCGVTAAAAGGSAAATQRPAGGGRGGGGGKTPTAGATPEMQKALKIADGTLPAPAPEITAALAAKGACGTFAKDGLRAEACKQAGFAANASSGYPDADLRAETLFDGPQTAADKEKGINRKLTIKPGDSPERTAIEAFIRNLETPLDLKTLSANEINSEAGRNYMALRDSYDAAMSLATKPVRDQQSLITASKLTLPVLKQLVKSEDSKYVIKKLDASFPSWKSDGISIAALMQLEADRRYLNEDWYVRMAGANEKQLLAEQVQLQALNGWMGVSMLERMQQQAIIQGTNAGAAIRSEKMPQLIAAHRAAKR